MQNLKNKTVIVTGASRGIGYQIALQLAQQGAHVIAIARTIGGLEELDDQIQKLGGSATLVPLDLKDTKKLQALGPSLIERFPTIDIVIGAAGYLSKLTSVAQGPAEHWDNSLAVNATANLHLLQTLHPLLKNAPGATVLFLTHDFKKLPNAYWGMYAAGKAALKEIVKAYNQENPNIRAEICKVPDTQTRLFEEAYPGRQDAQSPLLSAQFVMQQLLKTETA